MKFSLAQLQLIDVGVKVYNSIFDTNFKLVIQLYDSFYSCDFVKMQDNKLVLVHFLRNELKTQLVPLPDNSELQSLRNTLNLEFSGGNYSHGQTTKTTYESYKAFPDLLLKVIIDLLNTWECLEANEAYSGYPYIYNLKNLETGFSLPFAHLSLEDYNLASLYQCE